MENYILFWQKCKMFLSGFVEWSNQHRFCQNNQSGPILVIHFPWTVWQRERGLRKVVPREVPYWSCRQLPACESSEKEEMWRRHQEFIRWCHLQRRACRKVFSKPWKSQMHCSFAGWYAEHRFGHLTREDRNVMSKLVAGKRYTARGTECHCP